MGIEDSIDELKDRIATLERLTQDQLARLLTGVSAIEAQLASAAVDRRKEWFSVDEAAQALGKRPYTVREWCRDGRIKASKRDSGRGRDRDWEISREELDRYRNHGLRPRMRATSA